jgi:RimJ/RimL family protein N-acetyltransferase
VFNKQTNEYAGMTRYYEISNEFKRLEIGYTWYGKKHQGTGLNKNCKYLLLSFAFDTLEMIRVGFGANIHNDRSIRAMKSIGCKEEGIMRQYTRDADGNVVDRIVLSILKEEWNAGIKDQLKNKISQSH